MIAHNAKFNLEESRIRFALQGKDPPDAQTVIKRAIDWFQEGLVVACSFGRCSIAVLHMALKVNPNIKVVFNNTGVEYPETYRYKQEITKMLNLNLIETKPIKSFWKCVDEYGLPQIRGTRLHDKTTRTPHCCYFLKEKPMQLYARANHITATLVGTRVAESRVRTLSVSYYGNIHFNQKFQRWHILPIAYWSKQQVIDYLKDNGIPMNPIYEKIERSGCMPCTAFRHWELQLQSMNPKLYTIVQHKKGVGLIPDFFEPEPPCLEPTEL